MMYHPIEIKNGIFPSTPPNVTTKKGDDKADKTRTDADNDATHPKIEEGKFDKPKTEPDPDHTEIEKDADPTQKNNTSHPK